VVKFLIKKTTKGIPLIGIGLSCNNIAKLQDEEPIMFNLKDIGLNDCDVMIIAGETEESIAKDLERYIGPQTDIQDFKNG